MARRNCLPPSPLSRWAASIRLPTRSSRERARGAKLGGAKDLRSVTGEGVEATVGRRQVAIGNEKMMQQVGIDAAA